MKLLKFLPLLSLMLFPLASSSTQELPQPVLPGTEISCQDQAMCGRCGDGFCSKTCGENSTNCPADCGSVAL